LPEWFVGHDPRTLDTTAEMWAFFKAHRLTLGSVVFDAAGEGAGATQKRLSMYSASGPPFEAIRRHA
ncbi:MAG TPA: hypothetical protein VF219_23465, partial [Vicinamibacterales bacterium]